MQFYDPACSTWILLFAERSITLAPALTRRMSVPLAKLSERFYQKFGHDSVEELVTWLNQMDATYRTDLREVNELNFARFDAKLEQRVAELRQEMATLRADMIKWMFVFWAGTVVPLAGLMFALFQHFRPTP
jgi:hypothetical protein